LNRLPPLALKRKPTDMLPVRPGSSLALVRYSPVTALPGSGLRVRTKYSYLLSLSLAVRRPGLRILRLQSRADQSRPPSRPPSTWVGGPAPPELRARAAASQARRAAGSFAVRASLLSCSWFSSFLPSSTQA